MPSTRRLWTTLIGLCHLALAAGVFALALLIRSHNGRTLEGGGVLLQFVLSGWTLGMLRWRYRTALGRRLGLAVAVLSAALVLALSYVQVGLLLPMVLGVVVLFVVISGVDQRGPRWLHGLWLLAPIVIWCRHSLAEVRRLDHLEHAGEGDISRVTLQAPDGRAFVLRRPEQVRAVAAILAKMKPYNPNHEGISDAWTGEIALRDGTKATWKLGHSWRGGRSLWVDIDGYHYLAPYDWEATLRELVKEP